MPIEEMRQHEWVVSWSGGKDSTATIILMREHGIPIKKVVYAKMMYSQTLSATLPEMDEFVDKAVSKLRGWGIEVIIAETEKTAEAYANTRYKRSKFEYKIGATYGIGAFVRKGCRFQAEKPKAINKHITNEEWQMIGYASDEVDRIDRLGGGRQSIMVSAGVTEDDALKLCKKYDLLSPLYELGLFRDGCFFCPNCTKGYRAFLRREHPDLVRIITDMIEMCEYDIRYIRNVNCWVDDYMTEQQYCCKLF